MMQSKQRGAVAAYVVLVLSILLTVSVGVANFAVQSLTRVRQDRNSMIAEQASFAALDQMTSKAYTDLSSSTNGAFTASTLNLSSDVNAIAPGATATGWVTPSSLKVAYVTATATYKGISRSVRNNIQEKEVGIWNNAVFAGTGATGQAINGNVDIRGSLHILGEGEPYLDLNGNGQRDAAEDFVDKTPKNGIWDPGETFTDSNGDGAYTVAEPYNDMNANGIYDPPLTQTSLDSSFSGNAYVGNNYSGAPASLLAQIPIIPKVNGIGTLGAEVRVQHGMVSISGSASIGTGSVVDGGLSKATLDGMYVNDGYTGNQGASSVFSDNGTTNVYDLGNLGITFPVITGIGAQTYTAKDGSTWSTHQNYLDSKSMTIPVSTIVASTTSFSYGPDANGNSISFLKGSPGLINITGVIKIVGNLQLGEKNGDLAYTGSGTIYSTGSINVDGDLLPQAGKIFPTQTRLGLIAKQNLNLATGAGSSQLSMAGAFYAQGTIVSAKQNQIAGTFVASYFDMGANVPNIYQVPSLSSNMPPAMPGDKRYFTFKVLTFRDRSPLPGSGDSFNGGSPFAG
jgi:hypothetical protein